MIVSATGGVKVPIGSGQTKLNLNSLPVWSTPTGSLGSVTEDQTITSGGFQIVATDVDVNNTLTYSIYSGTLPNSVAYGNIDFAGQPNPGDTVIFNGNTFTFVASGATGLQVNIGSTTTDTQNNLAYVAGSSSIASLTGAAYSVLGTLVEIHYKTPGTGGNSYTLSVGVNTSGNLTASGSTLTGGGSNQAVLNSSTGEITGGTIHVGNTHTFTFVAQVEDNTGVPVRRQFSIKINDTADPVWHTDSGAFATPANEGVSGSSYTVEAVDFDGLPDPISYSIISGRFPHGFDWDDVPGGPSSTGVISGTPTLDDSDYDRDYGTAFTIESTDGLNTSDLSKKIYVYCTTFENGTGTSPANRAQKDVNGFLTTLNNIYGLGSGTTGYYQGNFSNPTSNLAVLKSDLLSYRTAISNCAAHQGITLNPALPATTLLDDPKPWDAEGFFDTMVQNVTTGTVNITDHPEYNSGDFTTTSGGSALTSTTAWSTTVQHIFTVQFIDSDHARAFFNAGGQIILSASRTGGSATTQNSDWSTLLSNAGNVIFDSSDYFALTTSYATLATFGGSGAYSANDWTISVHTDTIGSLRGGKGSLLTFRSQFNDDHTAIGAGPDSVDGTLSSFVDTRNVDGTYLTIAAATFTTTTAL